MISARSLAGDRRVDIYRFASWCLVLSGVVTLLWPLNVPILALAYKVRQGGKPIEMEPGEFWWRCCFGTLGLAGLSLAVLGLNYSLIHMVGLPPGPTQLVLLLAYVAAAIGYLFWMMSLEDMLQATGLFLLYVLMPGLPLLLVGRLSHTWETLMQSAPWLLAPT